MGNEQDDRAIAVQVMDVAIAEAAHLVAEGVSTVEQIDMAIKHALRWAQGPFEMAARDLDATVERLSRRHDVTPAELDVVRSLTASGCNG